MSVWYIDTGQASKSFRVCEVSTGNQWVIKLHFLFYHKQQKDSHPEKRYFALSVEVLALTNCLDWCLIFPWGEAVLTASLPHMHWVSVGGCLRFVPRFVNLAMEAKEGKLIETCSESRVCCVLSFLTDCWDVDDHVWGGPHLSKLAVTPPDSSVTVEMCRSCWRANWGELFIWCLS